MRSFDYDICIIGGGGHVGLPLALAFANEGLNVTIYDTNSDTVEMINQGVMTFSERGSQPVLEKVINNTLKAFNIPDVISESEYIIVVIGTPVDEHLNPDFTIFNRLLYSELEYLRNDQTLILRSTVYPGTSNKLKQLLEDKKLKIGVSFCPERIAEGKAMEELYTLPQIISGFDSQTVLKVRTLFSHINKEFVELTPIQAELAKLFTNSWRYIQFATANQFYMIAEEYGQDFYSIYNAMTCNYPRTKGFPKAGFAAGPCLFKDTMQLAAFTNNTFYLGHSAMLINEGLPVFLVNKIKMKFNLRKTVVGILGMAFKAESDDTRESLSFKLKKLLEFEAKEVMCTDEYVINQSFFPLKEVLEKADLLIIGVPHKKYHGLKIDKYVVDVWNVLQRDKKDTEQHMVQEKKR
jgi:UDP-N-acetyl-D-mannosaminuronic acid dehydrogenase